MIIKMFETRIAPFLDAMVERPMDFELTEFRFIDKKSGATVWIASGFWFYLFNYPTRARGRVSRRIDISISFLDKWRFSSAFKHWQEKYGSEPTLQNVMNAVSEASKK